MNNESVSVVNLWHLATSQSHVNVNRRTAVKTHKPYHYMLYITWSMSDWP